MTTRQIIRISILGLVVTASTVLPAAAQLVYATDIDTNTIWVIDGTTRVATIPMPGTPGMIVVTPDGRHAYVTQDCSVVVVDLAIRAVSDPPILLNQCQFPGPRSILLTPDGSQVYVGFGDDVAVISTATNTVSTTISNVLGVGTPDTGTPRINAMGLSPDGKSLYVSAAGQVFPGAVISTASNAVVGTVGSFRAVDLSGQFWTSLQFGGVSVRSTDFPMGCAPGVIGFTPDGKKAYVADYEPECGSLIHEIETAALRPTQGPDLSFPRPFEVASGMAFSQDSKVGYVAGGSGNGVVVVFDTTTDALITEIGPLPFPGSNPPVPGSANLAGIAVASAPNTPTSNPPGSPVTVLLNKGSITVTFEGGVTAAGTTAASNLGAGCPLAPAGFQLGTPPICYDITTTAQYTVPLQVCISDASVTTPSSSPW